MTIQGTGSKKAIALSFLFSYFVRYTFAFQIVTRKVTTTIWNKNLKVENPIERCNLKWNAPFTLLSKTNDGHETFFRRVDNSSNSKRYFSKKRYEGNFSDGINDAHVPVPEPSPPNNIKESRALKPRRLNPSQKSGRNPSTVEEYERRTSEQEMKLQERQEKLLERRREAMKRLEEKRQLHKEESIKQKEKERERFLKLKEQKEKKFQEKKLLLEKEAMERHETILKAQMEANMKEQLRIEKLRKEKEDRVLERKKLEQEKIKARREAYAREQEEKALMNQQRLQALQLKQKQAAEDIRKDELQLNKKITLAEKLSVEQSSTVQELNNVKDDEEKYKTLIQEHKEQLPVLSKQKKQVVHEINRLQFILKDTETVVEQLQTHLSTIQNETNVLQEVIHKAQIAMDRSNEEEKQRYKSVFVRASTMLSHKNKEKEKIEEDVKSASTIVQQTDQQIVDLIKDSNYLSEEVSTLEQSIEENTKILRNMVKAKLALQDKVKNDKVAKKKLLEEISSMEKCLNEKKIIENAAIEKGKRLLLDLNTDVAVHDDVAVKEDLIPSQEEVGQDENIMPQDFGNEDTTQELTQVKEVETTATIPIPQTNSQSITTISYPTLSLSIPKTNHPTATASAATKYSYTVSKNTYHIVDDTKDVASYQTTKIVTSYKNTHVYKLPTPPQQDIKEE